MVHNEGPRLRPDYNPGEARWCDKPGHMRMECTKRKKDHTTCHNPAIRGLNACKLHAGVSTQVALAKGQAKITAWSAIGSASKNMDYRMAVLGVLQMTWLRLGAYSELLRKQANTEGGQVIEHDAKNGSGLIGYRFGAAGKDGNIFAQSEEIRALVLLESQERDRVVRYAKVAHDMGISDRLTSLAEKWGDVVATRITLMLDQLDLSPEQAEKVPALIQAHLGSIDVDAMDDGTGDRS